MSRFEFVGRLCRVPGPSSSSDHRRRRRTSRSLRFNGLECLEGRAVPATINATGVISSAAVGPNFNFTINLTNASSSDSGVGTFWYAWVPGEDFLASRPISVSPPPGWTANITNMGPGDGFAIQFVANSAANDVQPGSSMSFSFTSADPPSSVDGHSPFFPGTPVNTAFVYPQGPFSDAGHQLVVAPAATPAPTPSPSPAPSPSPTPAPPVTVLGVQEVTSNRHSVTQLVVDLSGSVDAAQADNIADFRLTAANGNASFTARNSPVLRLRSAAFNPTNDTVTLTLRKAISRTKPVELTINGTSPSGLQDSSGQPIDGNGDGVAGGNAVVRISRAGIVLNPVAPARPAARRAVLPMPTRTIAPAASQTNPPVAIGTAPDPQSLALGTTLLPPPVAIGTMPPAQPGVTQFPQYPLF